MSKTGVLVIAHGSRDPQWIQWIEQAVEGTDIHLPIEIGFLEPVKHKSIKVGIHRLEQRGIQRIIVLPLFVTAGSTHITEIKYALGLIPKPTGIQMESVPVPRKSEIIWCSPLEDHRIVKDILADRVGELIQNPREELLFLIGHGSDKPGFHEHWENFLQNLSIHLKKRFGFKGVSYATLHPDTINKRAYALSKRNRLIVLPIFLSEGYFTKWVIPHKLKDLHCIYNGKAFLPHRLISKWIHESASKCIPGE